MSTVRRQKAKVKRGPAGERLCSCGCGNPVVPPRRSWHSQACVDAWRERNDIQLIRQRLWERDKGICALCGIDCEAAFAAYRDAFHEAERLAGWFIARARREESLEALRHEKQRILARWKPFGNWLLHRKTGWDADHIVPVAEGGGGCDYTGYRSLCHSCHAAQTKALAGRLASARRSNRMPTIQNFLPLDGGTFV